MIIVSTLLKSSFVKNFLKGNYVYLVSPVIASILTLITIPVGSWFFSTEQIGLFGLMTAYSAVLSALIGLGLLQYLIREFHNIPYKIEFLVRSILPGFLIFLVILAFFVTKYFFEDYVVFEEYYLFYFYVATHAFGTLLVNSAVQFSRLSNLSNVFGTLLIGSRFFPLFIISLVGLDLLPANQNFLLGSSSLISIIFGVFSMAIWVKTNLNWNVVLFGEWSKMLRFSVPTLITGILALIISNIDRFILDRYFTLESVGIYSVMVTLGSAISLVGLVITSNWYPKVYSWLGMRSDNLRIVAVNELIIVTMIVLFLLVIPFFPVLQYLIPREFHEALRLLPLISLNFVVFILADINGLGIYISRRPSWAILASVGTIGLNLFFSFLLSKYLALFGLVIANFFGGLVYLIIRTEVSRVIWFGFDRIWIYCCVILLGIVSILNYYISFSILSQAFISFGLVLFFLKLYGIKSNLMFRYIWMRVFY